MLFGADENYYFGSGNVRERGDAIVIRFGKVSEALYQSEQSEPNDNGFIEGVNELPATYSNVSNGHGVVFGQNWKEYQIKLN